jgi:hypothetical protein
MGKARALANVLNDFSATIEWTGYPTDQETFDNFRRLGSELRRQYGGTVSVNQSLYPELPPGVHPSQLRADEWPQGVKYLIELSSGIVLYVILSINGDIIERGYTDRGDVHTEDLLKMLRGWNKAIRQAQRGGRPKGMSKATQERYEKILKDWNISRSMTEEQFCKKAKITRRTLDRALDYQHKKSVTRNRP